MKIFVISAAVAGALTLSAFGLAGTAAASATGGGSAEDAINALQAKGYHVQINGSVSAPLAQCTVTGVHGETAGPLESGQFRTAYVDVSCPPLDD